MKNIIHSRPKTAAFRPRICSGRSVFRPQEPRALVLRETEGLARVGSIFSFSLIFFCFLGTVYAQTPEETYKRANLSYEDEDYENSSALYETLVKMDKVSPEVFYNLGNSYFKLKNIGKAILNYERALRLAPRARDIKRNLGLARAMAIDKIEPPERGFIRSRPQNRSLQGADGAWPLSISLQETAGFSPRSFILDAILFPYDNLNINELCVLISITYICVILLLMFSVFSITYAQRIFYVAGFFAALCIVFTAFLASKIYGENFVKQAVIISREVDVKSGPKEDYLSQFTLHEGTKVRIVEERKLWYEISISEDLKGWLPKEALEAI